MDGGRRQRGFSYHSFFWRRPRYRHRYPTWIFIYLSRSSRTNLTDPYQPPSIESRRRPPRSIGATDVVIGVLFLFVSAFSRLAGLALIFFYAISRNSLRDRFSGELNVKACISCDRELGKATRICPRCETQQPSLPTTSPLRSGDGRVSLSDSTDVVSDYCSVCNTNVVADDDGRCPHCKWPI